MYKMIALVCAVTVLGVAGVSNAKTMHAGVKGGLNIASLSGDGTDGLDSHNGFIGGAYYGIESGGFGGRIEGLYVMKGAEGEFVVPGDDHGHESVVKLDYLEFPVLFVANFPAGEKISFELFAGPTFGFNMGAEVEVIDHDETEDISELVNSFEFGAAIGGGFAYRLSSMSLILDVRYSLGATAVPDVDDSDVKTRGIGIMAGVEFPLGGN